MQLAGGIQPAALTRKPDVHEGDIGTMRGRAHDGVPRRRGNRADLVAELHHQHFQIHRKKSFIFDDQDQHASLPGRWGNNHLHGISIGTSSWFNSSAKLPDEGLDNARSHSRLRLVR